MRGGVARYFIGVTCIGLSVVMIAFVVYGWVIGDRVVGFSVAGILAAAAGLALMTHGSASGEPSRREAIVGTLGLWAFVPLLGAVPFWMDGGMDFLNAYFESMSGFTTTGATVLVDFDAFPTSLFLWRSLTQWLGGIGIIVLFIAVLPTLALAGRQLFFAETPGPKTELLAPRLRNTAVAVTAVYVLLTALAIVSYAVAGMPLFDAVANGLTTPSSGGFSPNGGSIGGYGLPAVEWLASLFMLFAGANFALQYRALRGEPGALTRDAEFRTYLVIIVLAVLALAWTLRGVYPFVEGARHAVFQVLAIVTTTGYASADFALWPETSQAILVLLMFIGGSAGSAAGGIKVVRWLIIVQQARAEMQRALHPRSVQALRVGDAVVSRDVMGAVAAFVTLFVAFTAGTTVVLVELGADFTTALTAAVACIGNIGPGLGAVGPMLNFAELHPASRALLIFGMYAGRLEIVTVFVVFLVGFWRVPRRRWIY